MTLTPPLLAGRQRYERVMDGWVDNTHDDALTHTVRLADPDEILDIFLFKDKTSYDKYTWEIFHTHPSTPYGFFSPAATHRSIPSR